MIIKVTPKIFAAACAFVADPKDPRWYLRYVRIEPCPGGGALLVATNGHRLISIRDENGVCETPFLAFGRNRSLIAECKKESIDSLFLTRDGMAMIAISAPDGPICDRVSFLSRNPTEDESLYPDWRSRAVGEELSSIDGPISVNPKYLGGFEQSVKLIYGARYPQITIQRCSGGRILVRSGDDIFGIVMEMDSDGTFVDVPDWLTIGVHEAGAEEKGKDD